MNCGRDCSEEGVGPVQQTRVYLLQYCVLSRVYVEVFCKPDIERARIGLCIAFTSTVKTADYIYC